MEYETYQHLFDMNYVEPSQDCCILMKHIGGDYSTVDLELVGFGVQKEKYKPFDLHYRSIVVVEDNQLVDLATLVNKRIYFICKDEVVRGILIEVINFIENGVEIVFNHNSMFELNK